jgi:hypothetical protein
MEDEDGRRVYDPVYLYVCMYVYMYVNIKVNHMCVCTTNVLMETDIKNKV